MAFEMWRLLSNAAALSVLSTHPDRMQAYPFSCETRKFTSFCAGVNGPSWLLLTLEFDAVLMELRRTFWW